MPGTTKADGSGVPTTRGNAARQPRCTRCIKQHKTCDGRQPCSLCTRVAMKPNSEACWYPPGMPSRRQLKDHEETYARIHGLMQQREATGNPMSAEELKALLPVYPTRASVKKAAAADDDTSSGNEDQNESLVKAALQDAADEQISGKRLEYVALPVRQFSATDSDVTMADATDESISPMSPASPPSNSQQVNRGPLLNELAHGQLQNPIWPQRNNFDDEFEAMEEVGRQLAQAIENGAPVHRGGILDGLSDWRGCEGLVNQLSEETIKEVNGMFQEIGEAVLAVAREAQGPASQDQSRS